MTGKVYIVGAGCGGAGLLTLRARELISGCGALVYDDLVHPDILALAPADARLIYMGKRSGHVSARQEDICETLVSLAREGLTVVRLKGGDPFVFGRGGEEMLALAGEGIPCAEVPGISSALAVPAEAGIPLTHRALSRGFHVVTAHTADTADGLPEYFSRLAGLPGTLVILMGLERLGRIALRLISSGAAPDTPAAVLSGGNSRRPAAVRGTLEDIAALAADAGVEAPAVIVVGQAAALRLSSTLPLAGVRVGLTGTAGFQSRLRPLLKAEGAEVFAAARSEVVPLQSGFDPAALEGGGWAVLTSANGVDAFIELLSGARFDLRRLRCRLAAIGPATAARLETHGLYADLVPPEPTTASLGSALLGRGAEGDTVWLLRSERGNPELAATLSRRFDVRDTALYTTRPEGRITSAAAEYTALAGYLVFPSAGAAEDFFASGGSIAPGTVPVAIGPVAARGLAAHGVKNALIPSSIGRKAIAELILETHRGRGETL